MNYIRTKDGIYQLADTSGPNQDGEYHYYGHNGHNEYTREVIKQADTIEELCDNYLVEYTNGEHMMFHDFYHLKRHHDFYGQDYHHVAGRYGCIWVVGKGLIYVAKMNKEGELEVI